MSTLTAVEIIADVPAMSVDQFVKTLAVDRFIQLQGGSSDVRVSFHGDFKSDAYQPALDISLADAAMPVDQAVERFRLRLFAEEFLRPFCSSLLLGAENPSRDMLEDHFDELQQLATSARREFIERAESGCLGGPQQNEFEGFARDFVSLLSELISNRVCDQRNERHLRSLLARLKVASA
jgi:hypothetical protein